MKFTLFFTLLLCTYTFSYSNYHIIVTLQAKSEHLKTLLEKLETVQILSLQEKECIRYEVLQNNYDPSRIVIDQVWADPYSYARQLEKSYIKDFLLILDAFLEKPYQYKLVHKLNDYE